MYMIIHSSFDAILVSMVTVTSLPGESIFKIMGSEVLPWELVCLEKFIP